MKKWSEVATSPAYLALGEEDRQAARRQYFDSVVAPSVAPEEADAAWSQFSKDAEAIPREPGKRNAFAVANDAVIEMANAAAGGVKAIGDFIAPGNRVSRGIGEFIEGGLKSQSDATKQAKARLNTEADQADGFVDEAKAMGRYVVQNPDLAVAQAVGSFAIPGAAVKGAGVAAKAVGAGAGGVTVAGQAGGVAAGAAMAGGDAAGNAYELVKKTPLDVVLQSEPGKKLSSTGRYSDSEIQEILATQAGRDASILPAIVGGVGGAFGAEKLLAGGKGFAGNAVSRGLKAGAVEAAQEGVEEGVTGYSGRAAAAEINPSIDPQKGLGVDVAGGAIMGFVPGAAIGAARQDRVIPPEPVDASTVLDAEAQPAQEAAQPSAPLALPAPRVVVDPSGQAIVEGSGKTFRDPDIDQPANVIGRAPIRETVQEELRALGLDPTQRATPTPITVSPDGQAVTDEQMPAARAAQQPDNTIDPPANVIGREPIREAVREELRALGLEPTQKATPTPIRVDGEGTARTDGDTRSVAEATQTALQREAARLYPNSKTTQQEWVQAETERQLGMDQRMRDLAEASNNKKRARGALQPVARAPIQRDLNATAELGVVKRQEQDGTTRYFFATQPENELVLQPGQGLDARKVVSISEAGQGALMRAALADGPVDAGPKTLARNTLREIPGVQADRFGVHRLVGRDGTRAKMEAELNRLATSTAIDLAEKKLTTDEDVELASQAIMADPRAAAIALRRADRDQIVERLQQITGQGRAQEVGSPDGQQDTTQDAGPAEDGGPAVRRSSGAPRAAGPDAGGRGRDQRVSPQAGQPADEAVDRPSYGEPTPGSVEVDAVHYSNAERTTLASAMYGTGAKGAEAGRLESADLRLKERIYFYVDKGSGISPEAGVGGVPHIVNLRNVYDADADPMRIFRDSKSRQDGELSVIAEGFDGYMTRNHNASGAVVLLGRHSVPVKPTQASNPNPGGRVVAPAKVEKTPLDELTSSTMVPMGALNGPRWRAVLAAVMPQIVDTYNSSPVWANDAPMYRDELARELKSKPQGEQDGQQREAGNGAGRNEGGATAPLEGAPRVQGAAGPDARLVAVAEQYARDNGLTLRRQERYAEVDPERAARIAQAYDAMGHAPQDPAVREAYENLIRQTVAQYRALESAGYKFWLFDESNDPYRGNPWNAMRDLRANQSMGVFATEAGYGSGATELDTDDNPLLVDTGINWPYGSPDGEPKRVLANDLFRAVHDAFGHGLEGSGFRAQGEENAWQAHARLFTGSALAALTSETRGQNSWLNYGPYGEQNRNAKVGDTVFADQKAGLMPEWTWQEGFDGEPQVSRRGRREMQEPDDLFGQEVGNRDQMVMNWVIQAPTDARKALGLPSFREARSITKRAFAEAVDKYRRGKIKASDNSPRARKLLATALADEVQWYASYAKDSGIDWYGKKFQAAIDELAKAVPSLKAQEDRGLFTALLATTSDGTEVQENLGHAMSMYLAFKDGKKLADSTPGAGKYESSYAKNAAYLDMMVEDMGVQGAIDMLLEEMYVAEVKVEMAMFGEKSPANDYPDDAVLPRAAVYLGPKLGAFYANLMGKTGYLTMDRWWNRTINRYRGNMAASASDSSIDSLRELIGEDLSDEKVVELAEQMARERQRKYEEARARGERYEATKAETLATTIYKNTQTELNDSPLGKADRAFQIAVVKEAQQMLRDRGVVADVAAIQATIWYYEKELFEAIGVKGRGRISYEEAARNWVDRRGEPAARQAAGNARGQNEENDRAADPTWGQTGDLFGPEVARARALSGSPGAQEVSRRGPSSIAAEMAALAGQTGRTPEALIGRFSAALSSDAKRPVEASLIQPEKGSRADKLIRQVKDAFDIDLVVFQSNDDAAPLGASVRAIPDAIFVSAQAARPEFVIGHEMLHELKKAYPDLYSTLVGKLRERAQSTMANEQAIRDDYRAAGVNNIESALVEEENMADVAGEAFADPGFMAEMEQALNPSQLKTFFRWVARWFGKHFAGKRDIGTQDGLRAAAADMREDIAAAYAEMGRRNGAVRSLAADAELSVRRTGRAPIDSSRQQIDRAHRQVKRLASMADGPYRVFFGDLVGGIVRDVSARPLSSGATKAELAEALSALKPVAEHYAMHGGGQLAIRSFEDALDGVSGQIIKRTGRTPRDITQTEAFKRWFGDSVATTTGKAGGPPLALYHGTFGDFNEFSENEKGMFFATTGQRSSAFVAHLADGRNGDDFDMTGANVMPVYLSLQNPLTLNAKSIRAIAKSIGRSDIEKFVANFEDSNVAERDAVRDYARQRGHDGMILSRDLMPTPDGRGDWGFTRSYVAFHPQQIKSATGNDGSFDPTNPDIRRTGRAERVVESWTKPERSAASRAADSAVLAASAVASPVTATMQKANELVDQIGKTIAQVTGLQKAGEGTMALVRKAVDARSSWGWVERVKQGMVSDFGLPEEYLGQKVEKQARENKLLRKAGKLLERMSSMGPDQLAVAYQWLQEKPDTRREADLLAKLSPAQREVMQQAKRDIDHLSKEAVKLGLISPEVYERNAFAYVHRSYKKYEAELTDSQILVRQRAQRLKGDQFKGRGMEMEATIDRIRGNLPDELMGLKVEMLEKRDDSGKLVRREYLRQGEARPAALRDYQSAGVWEVRGAKNGKLKVWRDFTREERQRMGEIEDARYGFARTMLQGVRDVETARLLDWVGTEYAREDADGLQVAEIKPLAQALGSQTFTRDEWVKVPETRIKGTQVNRYGTLAGKFVPGVMWNDLMAIGDFQATAWDKMLTAWKLSKTALSPAVHVNNVMSNFIMADLADVGVNDIRKALNVLVQSKRGDELARSLVERYQDSGAEAGSFAANEMQETVIEPLLQQIAESEPEAVQKASLMQVISLAAHGQIGEAAVAATKTLPARGVIAAGRGMIQAYQAEDSVFRLAKFLQEVDAGATDMEAGKAAKEAFLDYNINAPWIRTMRRTALPFISFTYRAAPLLVKNMATKPWKFAKYMGLGYGLSLLAYGMLGADADEEKERRLLPEEMQGTSILGLPKMVRMPWNDKDGDPVWLDVRRWLPGADIAELNNEQSAVALPSWLSAGGTLALALDLFSNTNRFGDEIVQETDTATQTAEKVADHIFKWAAPNLPLPGPGAGLRAVGAPVDQGSLDPYAWAALERSYSGAKSIGGNTKDLSLVVPNVLGVKLQDRRLQDELANLGFEYQAKEREIKANITRIGRQGANQRISSEEMQRRIKAEVEKLQELGRERGERMRP